MQHVKLLCLVGLLLFAAEANAKDKAASKPVDEKPVKAPSARTVNFNSAYGLSFSHLAELGGRIDRAYQNSDPVALANIANELARLEKTSGKKASIQAATLRKGAIELAKLRLDSAEIAMVAAIFSHDAATAKSLTAYVKQAKKLEKVLLAKAKAPQKTKGIYSDLIIDNESHQQISVYYNGRYLGSVSAHGHRHFHVHDHAHRHHFDLRAYGCHGSRWSRHVHGDYSNFTWRLHSAHH